MVFTSLSSHCFRHDSLPRQRPAGKGEYGAGSLAWSSRVNTAQGPFAFRTAKIEASYE
jgi:hypothetical protein